MAPEGSTRRAVAIAAIPDTLPGMCRRVTCKTCGKPDWAGCGAHVDAVLGDVPKADRCHCAEERARARVAARGSGAAGGDGGGRRGFLQRLLGG